MKCFASFLLALVAGLPAQSMVSIPQGFETTWAVSGYLLGPGFGALNFGGRSQIITDTSLWNGVGPIVISEMYIALSSSTSGTGSWDCSGLEVTLGSSVNDFNATPIGFELPGQAPFNPDPDANFSGDEVIVRPVSRWAGGPRPLGISWNSWQLRRPFAYDPSLGLDFLVDFKVCSGYTVPLSSGPRYVANSGSPIPPLRGRTNDGTCAGLVGGAAPPLLFVYEYKPATSVACSFGHNSGQAGFPIEFWDRSWTPDPSGIMSYSWDFGDGSFATGPNPYHTFQCQGPHAVTLTVMDGLGASDSMTRMVEVAPPAFRLTTTGVGDLNVLPPSLDCFPTIARGYTLISLSGTAGVVNQGSFLGLTFDANTLFAISQPPAIGSVFHYIPVPGLYPDIPLSFPPGSFSSLSGMPFDASVVYLDALGNPLLISNAEQVIF